MLFILLVTIVARAQEKEAYVVKTLQSYTLTFYYDDKKNNRVGSNIYDIDESYNWTQFTWEDQGTVLGC